MTNYHKFNEYNLDFEYNRNGDNPKRLPCRPYGAVPDLIVHQRGSNKYNLLVVEFKPYWETDTQADLKKLKQFVSPKGEYKYSCAKSIVLSFARDIPKSVTAPQQFGRNKQRKKISENGTKVPKNY